MAAAALTRRTFNSALVAALAAHVLRPGGALAAAGPTADQVFLNRLTFGATPEAQADLMARGRQGWLDHQLALPGDDPGLVAELAANLLRISYEAGDDGDGGRWPAVYELRPLSSLAADPADLLPLIDWTRPMDYGERIRPAQEVMAASLYRAVHAPAQLREVMTQFWHDHFNVHALKDEFVAVFFPSYDAALRRHALGNFRALLGAVASAPAMLIYLNNDASRASPANENFGRELLELHTLGAGNYLNDRIGHWADVPGAAEGLAQGYIDADVFEVARAFTGWTVGDGRWISEGSSAPLTGRFHYADIWHDPYQKRILGREMEANRAPLADGEEVLDMLASHPGTAQFICTKLARRLLADDPDPGLVNRLAAVFIAQAAAPDQLAQVVRALVADPAFAAPPSKLRRPFEFMAALYRATGAKIAAPEASYLWHLARAGWLQHSFPPPNGPADRFDDWNSGSVIARLVDIALYGHDDWFGATLTGLASQIPAKTDSLAGLFAFWADRLGVPATGLDQIITDLGASPADPVPEDPLERQNLSVIAVAAAALSVPFVLR